MAGERFVINTITDILRKWGSPQEAARKLTRIADEAPNTLTQFQPPVVAEQLDRAGRGYDDIAIMNPSDFKTLAQDQNSYDLDLYDKAKGGDLLRILQGKPSRATADINAGPDMRSSDTNAPYFQEGRYRATTNPGFDSNLELSFDSPPTPNPILRVDSHEGRNRSRTMSDRGDLETLVSLGTRSGYPKEAAHIKELLRNPQTEIYSQPDTTGQNSMRVGPLSQLFRLLGLGGISSLPMLED
jgi:hypothetical protein|tara:strand:+ start:756 stop:1481 length:726 start_codon:yes stop_codon:yes gene_type:complete